MLTQTLGIMFHSINVLVLYLHIAESVLCTFIISHPNNKQACNSITNTHFTLERKRNFTLATGVRVTLNRKDVEIRVPPVMLSLQITQCTIEQLSY